MSLIRLVNVTKRFGEITALNHLNLVVKDGEYVCVLGPTGAGKTTLLRVIAGLLTPDEGEIHIEGKIVNTLPPEQRNTMYMFQQYALFPHMTIWQNVSFGPIIKGLREDEVERISSEILELVELADRRDAFPHELSGGMQQRVALARGIAAGARILLLDEPLGALDARLRINIRSQLRTLVKDRGLTAIHVTHDQEEALMIADRVVVLRNGKIEQIGTPLELYSKPGSIFVASFIGGANFLEGTVIQVAKTGSLIEIRGGFQLHVSDHEKPIGRRVVIAVRLEDTAVGTSEVAGVNNFQGWIVSTTFIGDSQEYQIRLENGSRIVSKILLSAVARTFQEGERVTVSFSPEKCYIFNYPEKGLLKEIEAI